MEEANITDSYFKLDTNGTLRATKSFDYETDEHNYTITVRARDEYNGTVEGNFTIQLLDLNEEPYDLNASNNLAVQENLPAGTLVGTFTANDRDGDELIYKLAVDENNTLPFALSEKGELRTTQVLDFETQETHELEVLALDEEGSFTSGFFTVQVGLFCAHGGNPPIELDENGSVRVGGELLDDGGNNQNLDATSKYPLIHLVQLVVK